MPSADTGANKDQSGSIEFGSSEDELTEHEEMQVAAVSPKGLPADLSAFLGREDEDEPDTLRMR